MKRLASFAFGAACLLSGAAIAEDVNLPDTLVWTSFDTGSLGYNQSIAVGKALQDAYGISLRVLPTSTDQSRVAPARDGRVPFALAGSDAFYAFEGVLSYAAPDWGPQALTGVVLSGATNGVALGVAANGDVNTIEDLRGKRIGWVVGSASLQSNVRAFLAFGGLTIDDVELVEQPSYGGAWQAYSAGQIDAMTAVTSGSGLIEQAAASPQGLKWIEMPFSDTEGWARLQGVNPHFSQRNAIEGVGIDEANPLECAGVPYPVLITYMAEPDLVYNVTKAIDLQAPVYSIAQAGTSGWAANSQVYDWVIPYNEGAVRYYEEVGTWSAELQAHNDELVARGEVLQEAWAQMADVTATGDEFAAEWMEARATALEAAGMPVYFR
jgi:TRAP transporter TAXI family solute receptor